MRIDGFQVEKFGILQNLHLEKMPSVVIFLGRNEAGKSTLLEFFRSTLTGYPNARTSEAKHYVASPHDGGTLVLEEAGTIMRLTRHFGNRGGIALTDVHGKPLDTNSFDRLMQGIDRDIYCSIYGFGLGELQNVSTLTGAGVRNALYGASFGMGLQAPQSVLKKLEDEKLNFFRPSGRAHKLKPLMDACEDIDQEIKVLNEEMAHYDAMTQDLAIRIQCVKDLREERNTLEFEYRTLEQRLQAWEQWEQWRQLGLCLERVPDVAESFPIDGRIRMEHVLERIAVAEQRERSLGEVRESTHEALSLCKPDTALLELAARLHTLQEHKQIMRTALEAIPEVHLRLMQYDTDIQTSINALGEHWTAPRVHEYKAVYQDIAQRERFELCAHALQEAMAQMDTNKALTDRHEQDRRTAFQAFEDAQEHLASLPKPDIELDASSKLMLQAGVTQSHEAYAQACVRQEELDTATAQYARAITQMGIAHKHASIPFFDTLITSQTKLSLLAASVMQHTDYVHKAEREAKEARTEEMHVREHVESLQEEGTRLQGHDRHTLESQRKALYLLRETIHRLQVEHERLHAVQTRVQEHLTRRPSTLYRSTCLWFGFLCALAGGAFVAFYPVLDTQTLAKLLPANFVLHVWYGWFVGFVGFILAGFGFGRTTMHARQYALTLQQINEHLEKIQANVHVLDIESQDLSDQAGLLFDMENISARILQHEELLAREQERCTALVHWQGSMIAQHERVQTLHDRTSLCENSLHQDQISLKAAQQQWHDALANLRIAALLEPETVETFFARLENLRMQAVDVERLDNEVRTLNTRIHTFLAKARPLLVYHACITEDEALSDTDVLGKTDNALAVSQAGEYLSIERTQAAEVLRTAKNQADRTTIGYQEALGAFEASCQVHQQAQDEWCNHLLNLGLDIHLSPVSARYALEHIQKILHLLEEKAHTDASLVQYEHIVKNFAITLGELCTTLERPPLCTADEPDWLATLDSFMIALEEAHDQDEKAQHLARRLKEYEIEHREAKRQAQELVESRDALLSLAHVSNVEAFLQHHTYKMERDKHLAKRHALEDALRVQASQRIQGADQESFKTFLTGFETLDRNTLIVRFKELKEYLAIMQDRLEKEGQDARVLEDRLDRLRTSTRLADLRIQRNALCEQASQLAQTWASYALAQHLFLEAKKRFEQEQQPHVMQRASSLLQDITGGAWTHIITSLDDASLRVMSSSGSPRPTDMLSRGTQEQAYLALRLAHIRNHAAQAIALPIITDDILVNFDIKRMERTIHVLAGMTKDTLDPITGKSLQGHQILFFTCHEHIATTVQKRIPDTALHVLEQGKFV